MSVQIDTMKVRDAASRISKINSEIDGDYCLVDTAINKMRKKWKGNAADSAINAAMQIKKATKDSRYASINELVTFLNSRVTDKYDTAESIVASAADAFK